MAIILSIVASIAAFLGGAIALKFRDRLHVILGLSAGAVLGAALIDLIPEATELGRGVLRVGDVTALAASGFVIYLILDRLFMFHGHSQDGNAAAGSSQVGAGAPGRNLFGRGSLGASSFTLHSFIDGAAIGLAFQASAAVGAAVAIAVIAHRFSDGINTVGVVMRHSREGRGAKTWLTAVGLAPIVGAASTLAFRVGDATLAIILAIFSGFFLYISASDLIPEGHHSHSRFLTTAMTVVGVAALFAIVRLAEV